MDKVTKQRDPKRQAAGRKGHEKYISKLKEDILKNVGNTTNDSPNTTNDSPNDTTTTGSGSTITNFSYIHGVGAIAALAVGLCIFIIPKMMTNPSQRDKDPEKISKNPKRSLKSDGKCYNKQDDNTTI